MPLKIEPRCKICQKVRRNEKLLQRIYASKAFVKGGEPLWGIAADESMQYRALTEHVKRHQTIDAEMVSEARLKALAKKEEQKLVRKLVRTADVRQEMVDRLTTEFDGRDLSELSDRDLVSLLARVSKDTDDVQAKAKDQDIDVMRMMQGIRSGEVLEANVIEGEYEEFDPWKAPLTSAAE